MIHHEYVEVARSQFVFIHLGECSLLLERIWVQGEKHSFHDKVVASCLSVLTENRLIPVMESYRVPVSDLKELKTVASQLSIDLRMAAAEKPEQFAKLVNGMFLLGLLLGRTALSDIKAGELVSSYLGDESFVACVSLDQNLPRVEGDCLRFVAKKTSPESLKVTITDYSFSFDSMELSSTPIVKEGKVV